MIHKILEKLRLKKMKYLAVILAAVVVFTTTYALILPAITVESDVAAEVGIFQDEEDSYVGASYEDAGTDTVDAAEEAEFAVGEPDAGNDDAADAGVGDVDAVDADGTAVLDETDVADGENPVVGDAPQDNTDLVDADMPAMQFEAEDATGEWVVKVNVEAEAGTFPAGTQMQVREVTDASYVSEAVAQVAADQFSGVKAFQAVDITFFDADGNEIEPAKMIKVTISSDLIREESQKEAVNDPVIVHIADNGDTEVVDELPEWKQTDEPGEDEVVFEAKQFSVYAIVVLDDIANLDGKSYGIVNNQDKATGNALGTTPSNNETRLSRTETIIRIEPVGRTDTVFVAKNSNIVMWTFTKIEGNQYHIAAATDSGLKYLSITAAGVKLLDSTQIDDSCLITVTKGTGANAGKFKFTGNGTALYYHKNNKDFEIIASTNTSAGVWMYLAELSTSLNDDDFVTYTATKVSVSGELDDQGIMQYDVKDGDQVILYTRIWNEETLRYDYYTVDYDGMLVMAYESGDTISWVGSKVNTMLWDFTEYHYDDGSPNYYYELQNNYSQKYIAPTYSADSFLSDGTIGINLNGRRNGQYYTTVIAWDDPYYDYAALKVWNKKMICVPLKYADTFYFAVMKKEETTQDLEPVEAIDHKPFGITLKMQDYQKLKEYSNVGYRSEEQTDVLVELAYNQWVGVKNLVSRNLEKSDLASNGYPIATRSGSSLYELYDEAIEVNQQFLLTTYKETGYFEYDSTQNFAHLITSNQDYWFGKERPDGGTYGIGDFVIYEALGTSSEGNKDTLKHGQFFPYNDLVDSNGKPIKKSTKYYNETDIHADPLSSLDPRKGEAMYELTFKAGETAPKYVDHFFGMEMSASFMQSASGLDDWGHDLIFEFSGDDDFWLYVDDVLVLDLGGIHSALDGNINFRTGVVEENGTKTNLRNCFELAYKEAHPDDTQEQVDAWLDSIFKEDENGVKTVFKDYSGHTMRMFYMERGAGASNIHMRFNLAPYHEGEVLLEKEVSGLEAVDPTMRFPFQILYQDPAYPDGRFVPVEKGDTRIKITDAKTGEALPEDAYESTYSIGGLTYENVFFLHPDQMISIVFPDEESHYYIQECAMDTRTFDVVTANGTVVPLSNTTAQYLKDYRIEDSTVAGRKKVIFNNHVDDAALKSLTVRKLLWQEDEKLHPITADEDGTEFQFRIKIGGVAYNTGKYYVKNPEGYYCFYQGGQFVSSGKKVFSELNPVVPIGQWKSEQDRATFYTSPGGAADKIKAGYSIEIPGLMAGTTFEVEEWDSEIPLGYHRIGYSREELTEEGKFVEIDPPSGENANSGVIVEDVYMTVHNQHGYGLRLNKQWSDAAFMENHDVTYFAVYLGEGATEPLAGTIRQLGTTATSLRWFFHQLAEGKTLNDYLIYEVKLNGEFTVADGVVTPGEGFEVTRIEDQEKIIVRGTTSEHAYATNFEYTVEYVRGLLTPEQLEQDVNSRGDIVKNSRPGIKLVKTDVDGNVLSGGKFTLVKQSDPSLKKTFTSDEEGLIAVAYLSVGEDYILTEEAAPYRHLALMQSMTIRVDSGNTVYVDGKTTPAAGDPYTITQVAVPTASNMPTVTILNRSFTLRAVKVDATDQSRTVSGVEFELHREVIDYERQVPMPDYLPMQGFESLVTGADGVIPKINLTNLTPGVYYLREVDNPANYKNIDYDIRLTIKETGEIYVQKAVYDSAQHKWVFTDFPKNGGAEIVTAANGNVTLYVRNTPAENVRIIKKSYSEQTKTLAGAQFALYKDGQLDNGKPKEGATPIVSGTTGEDGILELGALNVNTNYYLFEMMAPDGYQILSDPIIITQMSNGDINAYYQGAALPIETTEGTATTVTIHQITVFNSSGFVLPATGGSGTKWFYIIGGMVVLGAGLALILKRRKRNDA